MDLLLHMIFISTLFLAPQLSSAVSSYGFQARLTRVESMGKFNKLEFISRELHKSKFRVARLAGRAQNNSIGDAQVPVHIGQGEYLMDLGIGTPPLYFPAIVDTGSDLIWTQCSQCVKCLKQPTPLFDPTNSSTFSIISCNATACEELPEYTCNRNRVCIYDYRYADKSGTQGVLGKESLTFGSDEKVTIPNITFGCGLANSGSSANGSGLVGFGRGPLSLPSQTTVGKFSYCLTRLNESKPSHMLFGSLAELNSTSTGDVQSTPFVQNPSQPSFYYLSLVGISLGSTNLSIPDSAFQLHEDGSGGFIIDSGTTLTILQEEAFSALREEFISQVDLPVAKVENFDLCFSISSTTSTNVSVPQLVFHFDGADLVPPAENYIVVDPDSGVLCLAISSSRNGSILGNLMQQNFHVLYDIENENLSFVSAQCDQL